MLKKHNNAVYIKSTREKDEYWQCGQWVRGVENATRYFDVSEAEMVIALRSLHNVEIIKAQR